MRSKKTYLASGYPEDMIDIALAMTDEERHDYYAITDQALAGVPAAVALLHKKFGDLPYGRIMTLQRLLSDALTPSEMRQVAAKATCDLNAVAHMAPETAEAVQAERVRQTSTLLALRLDAGMSQAELSRRSGVNARQIRSIERGDIKIGNQTLANAAALAAALGIHAEELLNYDAAQNA